jgi:hypothetical protein
MAFIVWILAFWVIIPCGFVGGFQRFGGTYYRHLYGEDYSASESRRPHCAFYYPFLLIVIFFNISPKDVNPHL